MRVILFFLAIIHLTACWPKPRTRPVVSVQHVWGNKPVYMARSEAKSISYIDSPQVVRIPGNIYAKGDLIYQLETGKGIHVINNAVPSQAERIGFIVVNGSSQISIKGNFLYTNSYEDLVVIDISTPGTVNLVKRVPNAFASGSAFYYYVEPPESGYYECPRYDSVIVDWVKDSIWTNCFKD